jgi:hypothetical protein
MLIAFSRGGQEGGDDMKSLYALLYTFTGCIMALAAAAQQMRPDSLPKEQLRMEQYSSFSRTADTSDKNYTLPGRESRESNEISALAARGRMTISVTGLEKQEISITVYDVIGNRLFSTQFFKDSAENLLITPDKQFEPGIYFITGTTSGNRVIKQLKLMIN